MKNLQGKNRKHIVIALAIGGLISIVALVEQVIQGPTGRIAYLFVPGGIVGFFVSAAVSGNPHGGSNFIINLVGTSFNFALYSGLTLFLTKLLVRARE